MKLLGTVASVAVLCLVVAACGGGGRHHARTRTAPSQRLTSVPSQTLTSVIPSERLIGGSVYTFGDVGVGYKLRALEHDTPTPVAGIHGQVVQVASSNSDGYALTAAGTVYAWGGGGLGELGNDSRSRYETTAVRVRFPARVRIATLPNPMPYNGALAIDSRGHVWGWGLNRSSDLCLPSRIELVPRRIPLTDVTLGTGARTHSLFDSHGALYACGSGAAGELGDGSMRTRRDPVRVRGLPRRSRIIALTSSWEGSGALLANGAYYDWGYNASGQLGDDTTVNSDLPVRVQLPGAVRHVFQGGSRAGNGQTVAILEDGSVWSWGDGSWGQLGDGGTINSPVPVRVELPGRVSFRQVNSGGYASYAIDNLGRLWVWGANNLGQLGTGSTALVEPQPVDAGLHFKQVSSTSTNVVALGS